MALLASTFTQQRLLHEVQAVMATSVLGLDRVEQLSEAGLLPDDLVKRQVWSVLAGLFPAGHSPERRQQQRFPYPQLLYLTPVDPVTNVACGESLVVVGKHLSERGLGFYYREPIPYRRMIASLELQQGR